MANLQIDVRSDLARLKRCHGELGREFEYIQSLVDQKPRSDQPYDDMESRRVLVEKFNGLLGKIREKDGFETFLSCAPESDIIKLSIFGPIVVINVSKLRSDAFLIEKETIRLLSLPSLKGEDLVSHTSTFLEATNPSIRGYSDSLKSLNKVLNWLWDALVDPILKALKLTTTPDVKQREAWPKIWWIGSGLLNVLPLHAAGYHDDGSARTAIDRVISSYAPSLRSLAYARQRREQTANVKHQNCLLVSMPETPGLNDLQYVKDEIWTLTALLSSSRAPHIYMHISENPTSTSVLSTICSYQVVHFACHGISSITDPSQSSLFLSDCSNKLLTVAEIALQNIHSSQFAYFSACHTASVRDFTLLNESITLSSAIQLAGFPSVVGTLWQVQIKSR